MKTKFLNRSLLGITAGLCITFAVNSQTLKPQVIATQQACFTCHQVETKLIGPAFVSVAEKYKGQPSAKDALRAKIKNGGAGNWGRIPMPAHPSIPDDQLAVLVDWVLAGAPAQ